MENYLASQRDQIFKNVEVLIYVFDVESREMDKDYRSTLPFPSRDTLFLPFSLGLSVHVFGLE